MKGKLILTVEKAQKDHDAWLRVRSEGIGGSDIAAIMGLNPWKSKLELWEGKVDPSKAEDISNKPPVKLGSFLEDYAANEFVEATGKKIRRVGTLADEEFPFLHANADRLIVGEEAGLEVKTASRFKKGEWEGDNVPDAYYLQCQFYMMVTGFPKWYICCLFRDDGAFVWKEVPRNDDDIATFRKAAVEFWNNHVLAGVAPETDGSESCTNTLSRMYPKSNALACQLPSETAALLESWDQLKTTEAIVKKQKEEISNRLKAIMGDFEVGEFGDRKVSWKSQAGRTTIDSKKLKAEFPDAYAACAKVGAATRPFKIN